MSELNFTDGVSISTAGPARVIELKDGVYVAGHGMLIPCSDRAKAKQVQDDLNKFEPKKERK